MFKKSVYCNWRFPKVFYGWWIVTAIFLISSYTSGVTMYGFTALIEPLAEEFGWSYAQISFAASIRGLGASLFVPFLGMIIDRWGPRKPTFMGAIFAGLGLLFLSYSTSLMTLYGAYILISLGMGTGGGIILATVVGNWFRRKVSIATSIAVCGSAFGGLLVPLVTRIIDIFDWRAAMLIFGFGAWAIILPLSLVLRHKPEQYGYSLDGDVIGKPNYSTGLTSAPTIKVEFGARQALKSRPFWQISLGSMCLGIAAATVVTHVMPYLSSIGIPRSTSSLVASAIALSGILGRLSFGWFGDRYDKRRITAIGFAMSILSLLLFSYVDTLGIWLLVPFTILFGVGWGGCIPLLPALLLEYFGRFKLGTILGLSLGLIMIGNVVGPPLGGWIFDNFGRYQRAWFIFAGVTLVGMIGVITAPSVNKTRQMANRMKD